MSEFTLYYTGADGIAREQQVDGSVESLLNEITWLEERGCSDLSAWDADDNVVYTGGAPCAELDIHRNAL